MMLVLVLGVLPPLVAAIGAWLACGTTRPAPALLFGAFVLGAMSALAASTIVLRPIAALLEVHIGGEAGRLLMIALIAPVLEEAVKVGLAASLLATQREGAFTALGIVLALAVGLGFAASENHRFFASAFWRMDSEGYRTFVLNRTFLTAPMHGVACVLGVAPLAFALRRGWGAFRLVAVAVVGFVAAVGYHAAWNALMLVKGTLDVSLVLLAWLLIWGGVAATAVVFFLSVRREASRLRDGLTRMGADPALAGQWLLDIEQAHQVHAAARVARRAVAGETTP